MHLTLVIAFIGMDTGSLECHFLLSIASAMSGFFESTDTRNQIEATSIAYTTESLRARLADSHTTINNTIV
jgi:hypothetical protein